MAAFIAPLIGGLAGLFGGGQQQKTQTQGTINTSGTQTQTGTNTGQSTTSNTNTPNLSPFQTQLANLFTKGASDLYNQSTNMNGYEQTGLEGINQNANLQNKVLNNTLASRGLSYSPAAATSLTQQRLGQAQQQNQFSASIPLLQRQLQEQSLGQLMQAFQVLPTGSTQTGQTNQSQTSNVTGTSSNTQTQNGTNLVSGNPVAGALSGIGAGLFAPIGGSGQTPLGQIINMFGGGSGGSGTTPGWQQNGVG